MKHINFTQRILLLLSLAFVLGCGTKEVELTRADLTAIVDPQTNLPSFYHDDKPYTGITTDFIVESGVKMVTTYKNGFQDGPQTGWHNNGNKEREFYFKAGQPEGKQVVFYQTGQRYFESYYKDGKPSGTVNHWFLSGKIQMVVEYRQGVEITRTVFDEDGNKIEPIDTTSTNSTK